MARVSCPSCGRHQSGTAAFCASCGAGLGQIELELVGTGQVGPAAESAVVLGSTSNRRRIGFGLLTVMVVAVGAAMASSGKPTATGPSTTSTTSTTLLPATSTTFPGEVASISRTTPTSVDLNWSTLDRTGTEFDLVPVVNVASAPVGASKMTAPPLGEEKTGLKMLLLRMDGPTAGDIVEHRDAIVDLDTGEVAHLSSPTTSSDGDVLFQTSSGVGLFNPLLGIGLRVWQPNGAYQEFTHGALSSLAGGLDSQVASGDEVWMIWRGQTFEDQNKVRLVHLDTRRGHITIAPVREGWMRIVGVDEANRLVVSPDGPGVFVYNPATRDFSRFRATDGTSPTLMSISGTTDLRYECDDRMVCQLFLATGNGRTKRLIESPMSGTWGQVWIAPITGHVIVQQQDPMSSVVTFEVIDSSNGERTVLGKVAAQSSYWRPQPAWSSDGRWIFVQTDDGIAAWRSGLRGPILLQRDGLPLRANAFGIFPTT